MGEDGCLKIGDFGLSRPDCDEPKSASPADRDSDQTHSAQDEATIIVPLVGRNTHKNPDNGHHHSGTASGDGHTTGVGTASYASPEQLEGRRYGLHTDLFSLGLVLLELCCCFTTTHERAAAFQSMRDPNGAAPVHLAERSPAIAGLAELLCRTTVERRPSAAEALEKLDRIMGQCGCRGCRGAVGAGIGGGYDSEGSEDARILREELAAKTRIVEQQVPWRFFRFVSKVRGQRACFAP